MKSLCICDYKTVAQNPDRPEIYISMMDSLQWLIDDLLEKGGQSDKTIIYCRTVRQVSELYWFLLSKLDDDIR